MTGKNPAILLYMGDWLRDVQLQCSSPATRGIWINFLMYMPNATVVGELRGDIPALCRLGGCTVAEMEQFIAEAEALDFCHTSRNAGGIITVRNRRLYRESVARVKGRERQSKYTAKHKNDADMTPPSSLTLTPSNTLSYKEKVLSNLPHLTKVVEWCNRYGLDLLECQRQISDATQWLLDNPDRSKTRFVAFYGRWIKKYAKDQAAKPKSLIEIGNELADQIGGDDGDNNG